MAISKPIGIFDSGVGGLSVVEEIYKQMPDADIIYFGDTAHVPYGSRTSEELRFFADRITSFLIGKGAEIIIDACNSTSSVALDYLQNKYDKPIIGVISPGINSALRKTETGRIGVIGTEATINSSSHARAALAVSSNIEIFGMICPLFVPLVERGDVYSKEAYRAAEEYIYPLLTKKIDTLILGCTHYPYLRKVIRDITGPGIAIIDPAVETVREAKKHLNSRSNNPDPVSNPKRIKLEEYYVSGDAFAFHRVGSELIGKELPKVKRVVL